MSTPLWESDHPYYCHAGNYYVSGMNYHEVHNTFESWADFIEEWGNTDPDMNLVFRWDWSVPDPDDYEPGEDLPPEELNIYWVLQRKAILRSTYIEIRREDEPAVREWLAERAKTIAAIWAPFDLAANAAEATK